MKLSNQWKQRRYWVCFLAFLGFITNYLMRVNLSVAIIAMSTDNQIKKDQQGLNWTHKEEANLLASFIYGYAVTQLPGGYLATVYGGKLLLFYSVLISSLLTFLTPLSTKLGFAAIIPVRISLGLAQGVMFPCIYSLVRKWIPPWQRGQLLIIIFTGSFVGSTIGMILGGVICDVIGWPWVFYIYGLCGLIWCIAWFFIVSESPIDDKKITQGELIIIQEALSSLPEDMDLKIPWKHIFLSLPVWAVNIAHSAFCFVFNFFVMHFPSFMRDVYHYNIKEASYATAIPQSVLTISSIIGGYATDFCMKHKYVTPTTTTKLFTCIALIFQAIFSMAATFWQEPSGAVICAVLNVGTGAIGWATYNVNHFDLCPQYSSITMGLSNTLGCFAAIAMLLLVGNVTSPKPGAGWIITLYTASGFCLVGAVVYAIFASGDRQLWAMNIYEYERSRHSKDNKNTASESVIGSVPSTRKKSSTRISFSEKVSYVKVPNGNAPV